MFTRPSIPNQSKARIASKPASQCKWFMRESPAAWLLMQVPCSRARPKSTMCYYDCFVFTCICWKWGNFRAHCSKEYRMGETCGMRLVNQTYTLDTKCKICEKIEVKEGRMSREYEKVTRWSAEGIHPASIEKSMRTIQELQQEIYQLDQERARRRNNLNGHSHHA